MPPLQNIIGITFFYILFFLISSSFYYSLFTSYNSFTLKFILTPLFTLSSSLCIITHIQSMLTSNAITFNTSSLPFIQSNHNCNICCITKPNRTHHCTICNKCILEMDHHCIWIGNCVGLYNIKQFYLMLLYSFISCFICVCVTFVDCLNYFRTNFTNVNEYNRYTVLTIREVLIMLFESGGTIGCILGGFIMIGIAALMESGYENMKHGITNIERILYKNNIKECEHYKENVLKERIIEIFGEGWLRGLNPFIKGNNDAKERYEYIKDNYYVPIVGDDK